MRLREKQTPQELEHRRQLLSGLRGTVVGVGAGDEANFPHFPTTVSELIAVGPEPWLRAHAERHAAESPLLVRVIDAVAEALPMPDASVDAVVVAG